MKKKELSGREKQELDYIFNETEGDYERFISKAADRLADKLGCAVLGRTVPSDERRISKIEFLNPFNGVFVVVLVTSDLKAHSKVCSVPFQVSSEDMALFISRINTEFSMMALSSITLSLIQSVAVRLGSLGLGLSNLLFTIYELCRSADGERLFIEGEANLLSNGVLGKRELFKLKELLEKGELPGISSGNEVKTEIILGNEMPADELSSLSMVMTHYNIGKSEGSVGIIGPIRLNYSFVVPCVEYFAKVFSDCYNDKNKGEY
jgi:heat-inducible transcriptional repressor